MAKEGSSVKLYGMWASPYVLRAKIALKIKGIEYEYIEEDLANKSELLLQYNPVYKKVPVLVHNGLPIAESSIILEYIDETWTDPPYLLPKDPYQRAKDRFLATYLQQISETLGKTLMSEGKATDDLLQEYWKSLDVAEELMKDIFSNGSPSFQDSKPGYLDIVIYSFFWASDVMEEIFGLESLTAERYPTLFSWTKALSEVSEFQDVTPSKPQLLQLLYAMRPK